MAAAPPKSAASRAPAHNSKPLRAAIDSSEAADRHLLELGRLDALEASVRAECSQEVDALVLRHKGRLFVDVAGERIAIADRRAEVLELLETYADANRAELLADSGKKSLEMNHGTIGWKASRDKLVPTKADCPEGSSEMLSKVRGFITEQLQKLALFAAGASQFLRIKIEFDKVAMLKAVQAQAMDKAELRSAGFKLEEGQDEFFAKPNVVNMASQPTRFAE